MILDPVKIWTIIVALAVGTFLIRWSFLGLIGGRDLPEWALRHLRYTVVAILPGLIAPLILWPPATDGTPDPSRLAATAVALTIGIWKQSPIGAVVGGFATLYLVQFLTG